MNKKIKKKIETLQKRMQKLRQQLAGAKQQDDEPGEIDRLEAEIASVTDEVENLKAS